MRRALLLMLVVFGCAAVLAPSAAFATLIAPGGTEWDLTDGTYTPSFGSNTMSLWGTGTSSRVYYPATNSDWGLADPPGTPGRHIWANDLFDAGTQALAISTGAANGGGTMINKYTLVMDVMLDGGNPQWPILFNATPDDSLAGMFYVGRYDNTTGMKLGMIDTEGGSMDMLQWYRIATVVDLTAGTVKGYINGSLAVSTSGSLDQSRVALTPHSNVLLFADNVSEGATGSWSLSGVWYGEGIALSGTQVTALGGPDGHGIYTIPEPSTFLLLATGLIGLLAYAWRKRR